MIWKKEPVPVFQRISSLLQHEYKTFAARLVCFCVLTRSLSRACYVLLFVVLTLVKHLVERGEKMRNVSLFVSSQIKIGVTGKIIESWAEKQNSRRSKR